MGQPPLRESNAALFTRLSAARLASRPFLRNPIYAPCEPTHAKNRVLAASPTDAATRPDFAIKMGNFTHSLPLRASKSQYSPFKCAQTTREVKTIYRIISAETAEISISCCTRNRLPARSRIISLERVTTEKQTYG